MVARVIQILTQDQIQLLILVVVSQVGNLKAVIDLVKQLFPSVKLVPAKPKLDFVPMTNPSDWSGSFAEEQCLVSDNPDVDADGILNGADNCPLISNADQRDLDNNLRGNACDENYHEFFQHYLEVNDYETFALFIICYGRTNCKFICVMHKLYLTYLPYEHYWNS